VEFATNDEAGAGMWFWPAPATCPPSRSAQLVALQKTCPGHQGACVNVVAYDSYVSDKHTHGMDEMSFNALFTEKAPLVFRLPHNLAGSFILRQLQ